MTASEMNKEAFEQLMDGLSNPPASFAEYLSQHAEAVGRLVNAVIPTGSHHDMNKYLYAPLMKYSQNGGKRHRPLICFASCVAVGGDVRKAVSAASSIEHFQSAALIHDDIADEADLRRGEPCLHLTEGLGLAINMGDLLLSMPNSAVLTDPLLDDATKIRVTLELIRMANRTIEGQALDLGWARDERYDVTPEDYLAMATHKTAHYSGAVPLAVGAIVGGATEEQVDALRRYGLATGLAFQIQDDLLNVDVDADATGKSFAGDITEGKRTLIVVHALQNSPKRDRLIEILSSKTTDRDELLEAVEIMRAAGSIQYARAYAEKLTREAEADLLEHIAPSAARDLLVSMGSYFVNRMK